MPRPELDFRLLEVASFSSRYSDVPYGDKAAPVKALPDRESAGAGLETFDMEPLPDQDELRALPNVLLTSHFG
jgi:D-isomer specific 2-hydroxyacid dehydrogenase, NAD binding domain